MPMTKEAYNFAAKRRQYRAATDASLAYAIEDIRKTLAAWPDHPNAGWYADDAHTVAAEINRRGKAETSPFCPTCGAKMPR
jgi:hypothetical protein